MRTYHSSKARVAMAPSFTSQGSGNQQGAMWGTYTFPRAGLHYQTPHASYSYCPGQPAVSPPPPPFYGQTLLAWDILSSLMGYMYL